VFNDAKISGETNLEGLECGPDHKAMHDGSMLITMPKRDERLNWSVLRFIGTLALFSISYAGLVGGGCFRSRL
jgi:hypothetical protein